MTITIAVDAMGGDNAPDPIVKGAIQAANANPVRILLVGDESKINPLLENRHYPENSIEVIHTDEEITMGESPKKAIESKPNSSIMKASRLVSQGRAQALVSAGSTGSVVLAAAKNIPRITGVRRTAIATVYPTMNENNRSDLLSLILDVGANVQCSSEELVQFAIMGSAYVSDVRGISDPKIALLNIGEESSKGGEKMQDSYRMLSDSTNLNFIGNIEGKDLLRGMADVVVTEGFVGNIVIKTLEGAAKSVWHLGRIAFKKKLTWKIGLFLLRKGVAMLKEVTDYSEYGGAPLLGFEKIVIIAHGRSNAKAMANAIKLAGKCVRDDVCGKIAKNIGEFEQSPDHEFERLTHDM